MHSKITSSLITIFLLGWFSIHAQTPLLDSQPVFQQTQRITKDHVNMPVVKDKRCATVEMHKWRQAQNPKGILSDQEFETWLQGEIKKRKQNNTKNVVMTLPIIFHIIHPNQAPGTGDNIGANYVNAQIIQLNNDFRKIAGTSGDNNDPVGADTEIEFCAAEIDPNGNTLAEPGINRVSASSQGFQNPPYGMGYVDGTIKPATIWNPNDYCNVWVCRLSGGLLGWAQFPSNSGLPGMPGNGGAANTDGVVCTSTSIGSTTLPFPGGAPYNLGRTLTHEIGHWVGLRHIWGDGGCGVDDFCNDTPVADGSNFGCPNSTSCGSPDMVENYMDYTDDFCMNIFTQDQKTRIQTVMSLSPRRGSIANSNACSNACGSLTIATNSTPADCTNNGTAGVTVNGATPPVTYLWSNAATTPTINNLPAGSYAVTVSDGTGCSLVESVDVLSTCTEFCDTLMNFLDGIHTPSLVASGGSGYISGHNNYLDIAKADYFDYSGGVHTEIKGTYIGVGFVSSSTPTNTFKISVWPGTAAGPSGAPIYSIDVTYGEMVALFTANGNQPFIHYVDFPGFVTMPGTKQFYVGMEIQNTAGDLIALTHTANGEVVPSTAWEQHSDFTWHSYTETPASWGYNVAHLIWPVIGTAPNVTIAPLNPSVCENVGINFSCNGTNVTDVEWIFPGGTPASSTNQNVTVSYAIPGNYTITHIAKNGCMEDTTELVNYVTINQCGCNVNPTTSFTEPNCNAGCDGTATVTPGSGVPPFTYVWGGAASGQSNQTATGLCQGTYDATATDANGCYSIVSITVTEPVGMTSSATVNSNVSCGGGSDGSASASANGGSTPYSYNWSSGEMTQTAINLTSGMQTVTITDSNGCSVLDTVTLTQPTPITVSTQVGQQPSCGQSNGVVSVQGSGGLPPLTYLWNNGQTTTTLIGLGAGTYTVTVTDAMNCQMVGSVTLNSPGGVSGATSVINNISCNGGSDGSATVNTTGGAPPITYNWGTVPPQNTQTATGLSVGNTSVTVSDDNGCTQVLTVTITQPFAVQGSAVVVSNGSCGGAGDGIATASATGGTSPYTYQWDNPGNGTTATVSNLSPGVWNVTITDNNGCTGTALVNINNVPGINVSAQTVGNASCAGGADGSVAGNATGGTPGYTYLWDDGQTTQTATGLTAGTYTVTITDAAGCEGTAQATISEPGAINVAVVTLQDANCGVANGALQCAAGGGAGGFTYLWDNVPPSTTPNLFGVPAGVYTVTVTDFSGCTQTASGTVGTIGGPTLTTTSTVETCNTGNGTATVNPVGGTTPYVYQWDAAAANQTTQTANNLGSGTYTVSVTDANGCVVVTTATVSDNCGSCNMTVSISSNDESCNNICDGDATATPASGAGPFTYVWSDGQNTQTASGLCLGTYDVTVTDATNCSVVSSITINGPTALSTTVSSTNPSCGSANGSITVTPGGGTPGYTYLWNNGQTTQTAINLAAGSYTVTVTDTNGCTEVASATLASPGGPTATVTSTNASCGVNNGTATATPQGGTSPYTYNWNDGQITQTAINLGAGTYTVTVSDANQCAVVETITISSTGGPTGTVSTTNATCGANNGSATATPQGGTGPYTYVWNNGQTAQTAINLGAGTYSATITDSNNCTVVVSGNVSSTGGPTITTTSTNATCGLNNGSATATPQGGLSPYTYNWNNGQTTQTAINLGAGTYNVTITDSNNCAAVSTVNVTSTNGPTATTTSTNATCGANNGTATATPTGGTSPYTYSWNNGQLVQTAVNLGAGTYTVTVTDANNCTVVETVTVSTSNGPAATASSVDATCGNNNGTATANPTGGTPGYTYIWNNAQTGQTATGLGAGTYMVTVLDANNCGVVVNVTVNNIAGPSATVTSTGATCAGSDGTATVNPAGGTAPYVYQWDASANNQVTQTANNLIPGIYLVTVTDDNGCTAVQQVSVADACVCNLSVTGIANNTTCAGNDGSATVTPTGAPPYTYQWDAATGNQTTPTATGLGIGIFSVTVTDANGCDETISLAVADGCVCNVMATITANNTTCAGNDGTATANPMGGAMPYTYQWDAATGNQTNQTATALPIGGYSVTITDAIGCTVVQQVSILDGCVCNVSAFVTVTNTTCAGSDGSATATPTGGTMPYTYQWDANANNQTSQTAINLPVGAYVVTITDANGCATIEQIAVLDGCVCNMVGTIFSTPTSCAGNDGTATVNVTGGLAPFTYQWDAATGNQTSQVATGLVVGGYAVTVTDANGCAIVQQISVADGCVCNVQATATSTPESCFGNDGTSTVSAGGGTGPYTYQWDALAGNQTTPTATGLTAGTYSVLVTDVFGCNTTTIVTVTNNCNCNIAVSIATTGTVCGDASGSATVNAGGGVPPFTFLWSNGLNTQTINNLLAGPYTVTVTDSGGCSQVQTTTVSDGGNIAAQVVTTNLTCNGDNSGSATVTNPGNLTYLWSSGQNTATINGVPAGTYTVTVTSGTCVDVVTVVVNEPDVLAVNVQGINSQCTANGGTASALASGGTAPFNYIWNTGSTSPSIGGLPTGVYTVTVTDNNGCVTIGSGSVTSVANGPSLSAVQTNVTCNGSNDGAIDLTVNNGTGPFTYDWNGLNVEDLSGLAPGNYTCVVTDANSCTAVITVDITEPDSMSLSWYTTPPGPTNDMGEAGVNVIGGTPGYTYTWSDGQTTQLATGLATGTYTVIIVDANGCTTSGTVSIWNPTATDEIESLSLFELYPNPSNGQFTVDLAFNQVEDIDFTIYSVLGQQLSKVSLRGSNFHIPVDISYAAAGTYIISIKSVDGGEVVKRFIITD